MESLQDLLESNQKWADISLLSKLNKMLNVSTIRDNLLTFDTAVNARHWYRECYLEGFIATKECAINKGKLKPRVRSFEIQPCYAGIMRFLQDNYFSC